MNQSLTAVYNIKTIDSTSSTAEWEGIEAITKHMNQGFIILWQHHAIFTGVIEAGKLHWLNESQPIEDDSHIIRLRAFNKTQEYHFWRSGVQIKGRLRTDAEGNAQDIVDTEMVLRGVVATKLFKEMRATERDTILIKTRNYIEVNELGQAGYVDSRFLDFDLVTI